MVARFASITTPVYYTQIGAHLFEHKTVPFTDTELPGINIADTDETLELDAEDASITIHTLNVRIDAAFAGATSATEARKAIADIDKAINVDKTWGGYARRTLPVSNTLIGDQEDLYITGVSVNIQIEYLTSAFEES